MLDVLLKINTMRINDLKLLICRSDLPTRSHLYHIVLKR